MQFETRDSENNSQVGIAITFLLIGVGTGALIALLATSKTGRRLRKDLRRKFEDAREAFQDWRAEVREAAAEAIERGAEFAEEIRDRAAPVIRGVRRS